MDGSADSHQKTDAKLVRCVYCCERSGETRDHVIARQFFPEPRPNNLVTVPCCTICNGEKRELEEYACTVFVSHSTALGASESAQQISDEKLQQWLTKRQKLREELVAGLKPVDVPPHLAASGVQFGIDIVESRVHPLIEMITRGLIFSFSKQLIPAGTGIRPAFDVDDRFLHRFGATFKTHKSVHGAFGDRVFAYAYQARDDDLFTSMWLYGFYDVVYAGAVVAPNHMLAIARRNVRVVMARRSRKSNALSTPSKHPAIRPRRKK